MSSAASPKASSALRSLEVLDGGLLGLFRLKDLVLERLTPFLAAGRALRFAHKPGLVYSAG